MANVYESAVDRLFNSIKAYVDRRTGVDLEILRSLQTRVDQLESARSMTFVGPHMPTEKAFRAGSVVQRSNSTWVALTETSETPGASSDWRRIGTDR